MPAETLGTQRHGHAAEKCADVDAHEEHGETGVASRATLRVEVTHHHADVGLEQSHSDHDDEKSEKEGLCVLEEQKRIADDDEQAADDHASLMAGEAIADPSTEERRHERRRDIETVD